MGLKLHEIENHAATGDLDGMPFRMEVAGGAYRVRIDDRDGWETTGAFEAPRRHAALPDRIRTIAYEAIARYRDHERNRATIA